MDEQRLQEIEGVFMARAGANGVTTACWADAATKGRALIAEVRRLRQEVSHWKTCSGCGEQMDAPGHCTNAETEWVKAQMDVAEQAMNARDAALAEVSQIRAERDADRKALTCLQQAHDIAQSERGRLGRIYTKFTDEVREALHGTWGTHCHVELVAEIKKRTANAVTSTQEIARLQQERDAALAKLEQVVAPLEVGGGREHYWKAQADAARAERDALFNSAWALLNDEPQANGEYVHAVTCSADRKKPIGCGGCSCQLGRRIKLLASALTEARRVLREVVLFIEYARHELRPTLVPGAQFPSQACADTMLAKIAAVLAQEGK